MKPPPLLLLRFFLVVVATTWTVEVAAAAAALVVNDESRRDETTMTTTQHPPPAAHHYHGFLRVGHRAGAATTDERNRNLQPTCPSLQTDEFDCPLTSLSDVWTEFDPLGDTPIYTTTSGSGELIIDVPAGGTPKNMWHGAQNTAPRLYQTMNALDNEKNFVVEVKFNALPEPSETYNDHGIFVRIGGGGGGGANDENDDVSSFLRFSSFSSSNGLYLFVSYICSTAAWTYHYAETGGKVYDRMRLVKTTGGAFAFSAGDVDGNPYEAIATIDPQSDHGPICPDPMALGGYTGVGLFAGNGNNNANDFKASFEYFRVYCDDGATLTSAVSCATTTAATNIFQPTDPSSTTTTTAETTTPPPETSTATPATTASTTATSPGTTPGTTQTTTTQATSATTTTTTATTTPPPDLFQGSPFSDPFTSVTLDPRWKLCDGTGCTAAPPIADGSNVYLDGSNLLIDVPSGTSHDLYCGPNQNLAPRVVQPLGSGATDLNFGMEAKFESIPCKQHQMQGLIVMESTPDAYLRFGTYSNGINLKFFFALIGANGVCSDVFYHGDVGGGVFPERLRLERSGGDNGAYYVYTAKYAAVAETDFTALQTVSIPVASLDATHIGVYGGNHDPNPEFVTSVDYFLVDADPIGVDSDESITELASCSASDLREIQVWSGRNVTFGGAGVGQDWINVLGTVPSGTTSLSYAISSDCDGTAASSDFAVTNPGPCSVRITSDGRRLHQNREFNVEVFADDLCVGTNFVELVVTGAFPQTVVVAVEYQPQQQQLALPYEVTWNDAQPLNEVGQMVDGHWGVEAGTNSIRTLNVGYDKIFTIGDRDWPANYEVLTRMTRHNNGNSIGTGMGWIGHYGRCTDPPCDCYPTGDQLQWKWPLETITWVRYGNSLQIWTYNNNSNGPVTGGSTSLAGLPGMGGDSQLVLGQYYNLRSRIEQILVNGNPYSHVQTKIWKDGEDEPSAWHLDVQFSNDPITMGRGSVFLLSYNTDASWGPVSVEPLPLASPGATTTSSSTTASTTTTDATSTSTSTSTASTTTPTTTSETTPSTTTATTTKAPTDAPTKAPTDAPTDAPTTAAMTTTTTSSTTPSTTATTTTTTTTSWEVIIEDDFEDGWGNFNDGGRDAKWFDNGDYANSGSGYLRIRDNNNLASSVSSDYINVSGFSRLVVDFYFYSRSMEIGEDFSLEVDKSDGAGWREVNRWKRGDNMDNGRWYHAAEDFPTCCGISIAEGSTEFRIRFVCDASGRRDWIYIDDVKVLGQH